MNLSFRLAALSVLAFVGFARATGDVATIYVDADLKPGLLLMFK